MVGTEYKAEGKGLQITHKKTKTTQTPFSFRKTWKMKNINICSRKRKFLLESNFPIQIASQSTPRSSQKKKFSIFNLQVCFAKKALVWINLSRKQTHNAAFLNNHVEKKTFHLPRNSKEKSHRR